MNILYLSYWGLNEGLTSSSVIPHVKVLSQLEEVDKIIFITIERSVDVKFLDSLEKTIHVPLKSENLSLGFLNKVNDFLIFPAQIIDLVKQHQIDQMICRTALGGALGYLVHKKSGIPFSVESFEPHADYMLEAKVWHKFGLKYMFQKYWEQKVAKYAKHLVTVSKHYTAELQSTYKREVKTFGCAVDLDKFSFSLKSRMSVRERLGWNRKLVGIYVGKFGDIYFEETAFQIFKAAFAFFGENFRLIVLSPNDKKWIQDQLFLNGLASENCFVDLVPHDEVPGYLSASDFAFSMVRPAPVRLHCSPIKDGEYWANGLPVLSAPNIGEDSEIIKRERAGAIFDVEMININAAFSSIKQLIEENDRGGHIRQIAERNRSFEQLPQLYLSILS